MPRFIDARIPVSFADPCRVAPGDAVLLEGDGPAPAAAAVARFRPGVHAPGCACCLPRGPVAAALGGLFLARVRGEVGFFTRVLACVQDRHAVRAALQEDPLLAARFRLADEAGG